VHVSGDLWFRTKPQIAAGLVRDVDVLGTVTLGWVVADEEYGHAGHFLAEMKSLEPPSTWCAL
jgi:hypothetical protein